MSTKQLQTAAYEDGKACFHAGTPFSYGGQLFKSIPLRTEWENGWTEAKRSTEPPPALSRFTGFLRDTLIPDLRADGMDATADDFDEALRWIGELREIALEFAPAAQSLAGQLDGEGRARLDAMLGTLHS